jgi:hypothetical protein
MVIQSEMIQPDTKNLVQKIEVKPTEMIPLGDTQPILPEPLEKKDLYLFKPTEMIPLGDTQPILPEPLEKKDLYLFKPKYN